MGLFNLIFKIPFVRSFVGHVVFTGLMVVGIKMGLGFLRLKYLTWIDKTTMDLFLSLIGAGILLFPLWKIGKWLLKTGLMSFVLYIAGSGVLHHFGLSKYSDKVLVISVILSGIYSPVMAIISRYKRSKLNLTMETIDSLGQTNGVSDGKAFEHYVCELYKAQGYKSKTVDEMKADGSLPAQLKGLSGDGGADVIAIDPVRNFKFVIQCKHYSKPVGREAIYQAHAALSTYSGTHALVVTNNFFTEEAKVTARDTNVILIDRFQLSKLVADASSNSKAS